MLIPSSTIINCSVPIKLVVPTPGDDRVKKTALGMVLMARISQSIRLLASPLGNVSAQDLDTYLWNVIKKVPRTGWYKVSLLITVEPMMGSETLSLEQTDTP